MFPNESPGFDINDFAEFDNNNNCDDNLGIGGLNWEGAGPSQLYLGGGVQGDLDPYPDFPSPSTAPTSLYPTHGVFTGEGYNSLFYQGAAMPSFSPRQAAATLPLSPQPPFLPPSPVPTLSRGSTSLSPQTYAAPITPTQYPYAQANPNLDYLGLDFSTATGSFSLPAVHPSLDYTSYEEELWRQYAQPDLSYLDKPPPAPVTVSGPPSLPVPPAYATPQGAVPPATPLAAPLASSSGSKRIKQPVTGRRRYDPIKSAKRKADSKNDWNLALVRFQDHFDTLYSVQNGQPSGGLVPEMALAEVHKFVKDDLKRSPLRDMKAGEGSRSRNGEDYLKGLLRAIRPVEPTSSTSGAESDENGAVAALSRLADELGAELAAVNPNSALRQSRGASGNGQKMEMEGDQAGKRVKKKESEKARRVSERHHLERISCLFKAPRQLWSKRDLLGLAVLFRLYGPNAFPRDFVEVRPIPPNAVNKS